MNLWLREATEKYGNKIALIYEMTQLTYNELHKKVISIAKRLPNVKRVGLFIENSLDSVILIHALMERGIEMVMINTRLASNEIMKQLNDVEVKTVITTREANVLNDLNLNILLFKDIEHGKVMSDPSSKHKHDILSIMFTSGTTGQAKAVAQSYLNHYASHKNAQRGLGYSSDSIWLMVNPIFHISGFSIVMRAVITGCTLIVHNKFNSAEVWNDIEKYRVTHTSFVPVMLSRLMQDELINKVNHSSLEAILMGGANTTPKLLKKAIDNKLPVFNSFGMTETCSQLVMVAYTDREILSGTVGVTNSNIKINNNSELLVKGDSITKGYLNARLPLESGYFNTGDIAEIHNGYLFIKDRREDLIISGGENIYPKEIENIVLSHSNLENCVVVKKDSNKWGQVPVLIIDGEISNEALETIFNNHLARYKHPKEIIRVKEIIYTPTGKISRKLNREKYIE